VGFGIHGGGLALLGIGGELGGFCGGAFGGGIGVEGSDLGGSMAAGWNWVVRMPWIFGSVFLSVWVKSMRKIRNRMEMRE